jgi:type II secretory pathway pseudopilin PulG
MVAAAIVAVGLTAAAVLASTLMQQQELNATALRAANVQEQAVKLHRLDLSSAAIRSILPEPCVASGAPPSGGYVLSFSVASTTNTIIDGAVVSLDKTSLTLIYPDIVAARNVTNRVDVFRPSTRVRYNQ